MQTIEKRFINKLQWGQGEWQSEPDKIQWQDEETGLPCLIVRNPMGALCGYVGVDESHPWFNINYGEAIDIDNDLALAPDEIIDVHGCLTYSDFCQPDEDHGICHIPDPGKPDRVWWFGFDCGHAGDAAPGYCLNLGTYKTVQYVKDQCRLLARQLKEVAS